LPRDFGVIAAVTRLRRKRSRNRDATAFADHGSCSIFLQQKEPVMKLRNLCLTAVVAALSLPALAAEPVDQPEPFNTNQVAAPAAEPNAAAGASAADERIGFPTLDENEDGFISPDEAKGTYLAPQFDGLDTDHDGRLSPSEVDAGSPK
jgi:hypothetical protein